MNLKPDLTIQKVLFSTTSRFIGEYKKNGILITHAWPSFFKGSIEMRFSESPISRSAYLFAFRTESYENKAGASIPDCSIYEDLICIYLSILFGKRFDNHGLLEGSGFFHIPDLNQFNYLCDPQLPQNSHSPRIDFNIPLNITEFSRIEELIFKSSLNDKFLKTFQSAGKFYLRALQISEHDPEIAYMNLITAREILSNFYDYQKENLLDDKIKNTLKIISISLPEGIKYVEEIQERLQQVKKRFTLTISSLVDDDFFSRSESQDMIGRFSSNTFRKSIGAAYDLRSCYLQTGISFGKWISIKIGDKHYEVQIGKPVLNDKKYANIISKAPTYVGLERIVRYCLIKFAQQNGIPIISQQENY